MVCNNGGKKCIIVKELKKGHKSH